MFSPLRAVFFPSRPLSASLSSHGKLNQRLSQESLSHSLMPSDWHLSMGLAIEKESAALLALGCSNVSGH